MYKHAPLSFYFHFMLILNLKLKNLLQHSIVEKRYFKILQKISLDNQNMYKVNRQVLLTNDSYNHSRFQNNILILFGSAMNKF